MKTRSRVENRSVLAPRRKLAAMAAAGDQLAAASIVGSASGRAAAASTQAAGSASAAAAGAAQSSHETAAADPAHQTAVATHMLSTQGGGRGPSLAQPSSRSRGPYQHRPDRNIFERGFRLEVLHDVASQFGGGRAALHCTQCGPAVQEMLEELVDLGDWSQTAAAISEELLEQRNDLQRQRDDLQRQRDDLERERDALVQQRDDPTGLVQRNVWLARAHIFGNPENTDRDSEHSDE